MTEYKVVVLGEATKEDMLKEQYRLESMGNEEWLVHEECNQSDAKLKDIDDWKRRKSNIGCGQYKNRKR